MTWERALHSNWFHQLHHLIQTEIELAIPLIFVKI